MNWCLVNGGLVDRCRSLRCGDRALAGFDLGVQTETAFEEHLNEGDTPTALRSSATTLTDLFDGLSASDDRRVDLTTGYPFAVTHEHPLMLGALNSFRPEVF